MKSKLLTTTALICATVGSHAATVSTWSASGGADPGVDGWSQDVTGTGNWFQGNSGSNAGGSSGAGAGNPAWGFWADSGGVSAGIWNLVGGSLNVGQTISLDFDNGWIDSGGVGVQFRSGSSVALSVFYNQGDPSYQINNSTGTVASGQTFTGNGFNISVQLTGSGAYQLDFLGYSGSGALANSNTTIDNIRVYSSDPTGSGSGSNYDIFANNIEVIPEPAAAALGLLGSLMILRRRRI